MIVPRTTRLQCLVVRPNFWLSKHGTRPFAAVEFHSWGVKIYGCPSDNYISIFGCPATFLVVPGARTIKISNAGLSGSANNKGLLHFSKRAVLFSCRKDARGPCQLTTFSYDPTQRNPLECNLSTKPLED